MPRSSSTDAVSSARNASSQMSVAMSGAPPADVLAGTVEAAIRALGVATPELRLFELGENRSSGLDPREHLGHPSAWPDQLGILHQSLVARDARHAAGVFYTPPRIARRLVELALPAGAPSTGPGTGARTRVCDPATGAGAFLIAAARSLEQQGLSPRVIVEECLWGMDIDPLALAVAEAALFIWAAGRGGAPTRSRLVLGDALVGDPLEGFHLAEGFDAVVGNPPFQNQLGSTTARSPEAAAAARARFGARARAYSDSATLFLLQAIRLARPGARVVLIQPLSFLTARDAQAARRYLVDIADLEALWYCRDFVFDAQVRVCAPVLRNHEGSRQAQGSLARFEGPEVRATKPRRWRQGEPSGLSTWSPLIADLLGVPDLGPRVGSVLDAWCSATAGFRDQYYGLAGCVEEASASPSGDRCRLVTSGSIDPGRCTWGRRRVKFASESWRNPVVALERLDERLQAWAAAVLVPKVVIATQTKVLEAAVDEDGSWYPSVPVIAVIPNDPARLWHLAAVLLAPPVTAWAWANHAGGALSGDTIKLAARDVLMISSPREGPAWDRGAALVRSLADAGDERSWREGLDAFGEQMCEAYAVPAAPVMSWWTARLPRWREGEASPA